MRCFLIPLLSLAIGAMACSNSTTEADSATLNGRGGRPPGNEVDAARPGESTVAASQALAATPAGYGPAQGKPKPSGDQYRLLGIVDPDFDNMVAFALKVPRGWQAKQSFKREWDGAVPSNRVYVSFRSPDGSQRVDYLPFNAYQYSDGPMARELRGQKQAMGMDTRMAANELAPMSALAYVKQYLLPQLAQGGLEVRNVGNALQTAPRAGVPPAGGTPRTESKASVDGVLPNGNKVRVEARMSISEKQISGDTYYQWSVVPSVTQTSGGNLAATYEKTKIAQESIVSNPAWAKRNAELVNRGMQANSEASRRNHEQVMGNIAQQTAANTAAHNQRMAGIAAQGAANTARHNERMAASDRQMETYKAGDASRDRQHGAFVDNVINNETKYENPGTGQRVKLDNRYEHAYTDNKGNYYQSNTPIRVNDVNWQELAKVSLNDY